MQQGMTTDKVLRFMNLEELTMKPGWLAILATLAPKGKSDFQWLGLNVSHSVVQKIIVAQIIIIQNRAGNQAQMPNPSFPHLDNDKPHIVLYHLVKKNEELGHDDNLK